MNDDLKATQDQLQRAADAWRALTLDQQHAVQAQQKAAFPQFTGFTNLD